MAQITDFHQAQTLLKTQPTEVLLRVAARLLARSVPAIDALIGRSATLTTLRALSFARAAALAPKDRNIVIAAARAYPHGILHTVGNLFMEPIIGIGIFAGMPRDKIPNEIFHNIVMLSDVFAEVINISPPVWDPKHGNLSHLIIEQVRTASASAVGQDVDAAVGDPLWPDHIELERGLLGLNGGLRDVMERRWREMREQLLSRSGENWQVWTDWYDAWLAGRSPYPGLDAKTREDLEIGICLIPNEDWEQGAAHVNAIIAEMIAKAAAEAAPVPPLPPREPAEDPQPPPLRAAARFRTVAGQVDVDPSRSAADVPARELLHHAAALGCARKLWDVFPEGAQGDVPPAVANVLDVLGSEEWREPDVLKFAARPIAAMAVAYQHPQAEWEISPPQAASLFELHLALRDLLGFVRKSVARTEEAIEELEIDDKRAEALKIPLDVVAEVVFASVGTASDSVSDIFDAARAAAAATRAPQEVRFIAGERVLLVENLMIAVGRGLDDMEKERSAPVDAPEAAAKPERPKRNRSKPLDRKAREADEERFWRKIWVDVVSQIKKQAGPNWGRAIVDVVDQSIRRSPRTLAELGAILLAYATGPAWTATGLAVTLWLGPKVAKAMKGMPPGTE